MSNGIPGTIGADVHLLHQPGVEHRRPVEGRGRGGKGVGESPEGRGIPGEVDLARGPAVGAAGTRGGKRGRGRRGPNRTTGTRRRALRGGKGRGRAFGRRPRDKGVRWRGGKAESGQSSFNIHTRRHEGGRGGRRTLGTRRGRGRRRGGVSHAMAIEPTARTGETEAGEGAAGEGRPRTTGAAARRPAGGGGLNAGSNRGQTFLLRVFLLNWAMVESGELRTSST